MVIAECRTDLDCPFAEKDEAKALGARWDSAKRTWYVNEGTELDNFQQWLPRSRTYLDCPFEEKDQVKALGARWDIERRKWYITELQDAAPFERWIPTSGSASSGAPSTPPRASAAAEPDSPATMGSRKRGREAGERPTCPIHGIPFKGPFTSKNGHAHNRGREFYVCPYKDDKSAPGGACVSARPLAAPPPRRCAPRPCRCAAGLEGFPVGRRQRPLLGRELPPR